MSEPTAEAPSPRPRRIRTSHFARAKLEGVKLTGLTSYDMLTAAIFDEAGIDFLLVGDSAGNNVLGYTSTLPVTVDELIPLTRAVATSASRALVIADLPFGSYEAGPDQALLSSLRFMKEAGVQAVKLEGGAVRAPQIRHLVASGIPVMAHIGFTPQSEHALGGVKIQGRGDSIDLLMEDARAVQEAGAFSVVLEMVPAEAARRVTEELDIPTIGVGAGPHVDAQLLVWTDFAGLTGGRVPTFVKKYADLRSVLSGAVASYRQDVEDGTFPGPEHSFGQ